MGVASSTVATGGRTLGLWRPYPAGQAAVLVGRAPAGWHGTSPSAQPRAFAEAGMWAVAVDADDTGDIDAALAWVAGQGADTARIVILAHGGGCQEALDWALAHPERVRALALVAPTGVTLSQAIGYVLADFVGGHAAGGGRTHLWCTDDNTPALALADTLAATRHTLTGADDPAAVTAAVATAEGWANTAGAGELARWVGYVRALPSQTDPGLYRGGDGAISVPLGDGRMSWWFGDSGQGTVNTGDWTPQAAVLVNNSAVIESAGGVLTSQVYDSGTTGRALPSPGAGTWYWPLDGYFDGSDVRLLCGRARATAEFFEVFERHLLTIDPDTLDVTATTTGLEDLIQAADLLADGPFVYFHGDPGHTIARAPAASVETPATWRYWDGSTWSADPDAAAPMVTTAGTPLSALEGGGHTRRTRAGFMRAIKALQEPVVRLFLSGLPQGPWTELDPPLATPVTGTERWGSITPPGMYGYAVHWHPHLDDPVEGMCLAWNHNYFGGVGTPPLDDQDIVWGIPQFGYVPEPAN